MIKRRKDYEEYERPRHQRSWIRMYQVGSRVYKCRLIFHPGYWEEFNWFFKHCSVWEKLRYVSISIRHDMVMYYGPARTTKELDAEADAFNERWQKMVQSGAIEAAFRDDIEPLNVF